ncbi:MAG: hypothetical protein R3C40_09055 [Parvularculaceae bacterium]
MPGRALRTGGALAGLPAAVWAVIAFFLPLALVLAAAFPGLVSQLRADPETEDCGAALVQRATLLSSPGRSSRRLSYSASTICRNAMPSRSCIPVCSG